MAADTLEAVTVQSLATEVYKKLNMSKNKRPDGSEFVIFDKDRPEWMKDMAHDAHADMMPDDWKYEFIHDAVSALSEEDDEDTARDVLEPSCMYSDQLKWFSSHMDRPCYVDQAKEEFGSSGEEPIMHDVVQGMAYEQREVFELVLAFLENKVEEDSE